MFKRYYFVNDAGEIVQVIVPQQHDVGMIIEDTMCALLEATGTSFDWVDLDSTSTSSELVRKCTLENHPAWVIRGPLDNWEIVRHGMSNDFWLRDNLTGLIHYD